MLAPQGRTQSVIFGSNSPWPMGCSHPSGISTSVERPPSLVGDDEVADGTGVKDPEHEQEVPLFFSEIISELDQRKAQFGGMRNFPRKPIISRKVKADELRTRYTDFEYIYLTVLGFAWLHMNLEEVIRKNNGRPFKHNPGVQLLETHSGMTMHADRPGANALLRAAPLSLVEAFHIGKRRGSPKVCSISLFVSLLQHVESQLAPMSGHLMRACSVSSDSFWFGGPVWA